MEKQHELVSEILRRLSREGILDHVLLIGSWCSSFYKGYFKNIDYAPVLRTRDIDFLVPLRARFPRTTDITKLFTDLGFETEFLGNGCMRLESPELFLEFLIPEVGPPKEKPYALPQLKFNAQPLRHLQMLWRDPIVIDLSGVAVHLPHPADYALHKFIIWSERTKAEKKTKDRESAFLVLDALIEKGDLSHLKLAFENLTPKEKKRVLTTIETSGRQIPF